MSRSTRRHTVTARTPTRSPVANLPGYASCVAHDTVLTLFQELKPKLSESEDESSDGEDNGDDSIDLVYPAKGGKLSLRAQHPRVRRVTREAIRRCLTDICIKNAFPDGMDKYNEIARRALVKSAENLEDTELARKLKNDDEYGLTLASIVSISRPFSY